MLIVMIVMVHWWLLPVSVKTKHSSGEKYT